MHHTSPITHAFTVSARTDAVEVLINKLKFERAKAAARVLAELLDERLPLLPENTLLVPVPTVRSHIRQRGYDQVELITRHLARIREMPIVRALERTGHDTFHKLDRAGRQRVSKQAFRLSSSYGVPPDATLLLIDDIITTSTTMNAAAQALSPLGVPVWAAAVAYQPLSGSPLSTR